MPTKSNPEMPNSNNNNETSTETTHSGNSNRRKASESTFGSRTTILRLIFLASLAAAAGICGYVAYAIISGLEDEVAIQTYESVATMALQGAQEVISRKVEGNDVIASILSYAFPNASQWPFVGLQGYATIATKVADLSVATSLGYSVIVRPEQAAEFEAYAQQFYKTNGYPDSAGKSEFGFGIYGQNASVPYADHRYHDTTGETYYGSNYSILVPTLQHNRNNATSMMYNIHSEVFRGTALDSILACSKLPVFNSSLSPTCSVITDFIELIILPGPAALVYQPIYPANDPTTVVGIAGTSVLWEDVLIDIVPEYVIGMDCVIRTKTQTFTYVIDNGKPLLKGAGDLHDRDYTRYGKSIILNDKATNATASVHYNLTVYPTTVMLSRFNSKSPLIVSLGFVGVILFCTGLFFLYDFFVQSKSRQRKLILDMKRRFVRFISHEMRTPLNTVCMGLDLLQEELHNELERKSVKRQVSSSSSNPSEIEPLVVPDGAAVDDNEMESHCKNVTYWLDLTSDILENSHNAVSVLNDLLNYDKIETGNFSVELGVVPIWSLIKKTTAEFQIQAKNRKVDLRFVIQKSKERTDIEVGEPSAPLGQVNVIGDDVKLGQVIRNLVSNALKFTPPNGAVTVTAVHYPNGLPNVTPFTGSRKSKPPDIVATNARAGSVRITVQDTGVGMTEEQLKRLFAEGVQFDANKLQAGGGSGLGLCITKEIVQQHGGTIEASSPGRGMGATFTVDLPLYEVSSDTTEKIDKLLNIQENIVEKNMDAVNITDRETISEVSSTANQSTSQQHHILVVDDVISNSKMLVRLLERRGHTCVTAKNGQEALDAFIANKASAEAGNGKEVLFDTILMDYEMPIMDGPEATRRIRSLGCKAAIFGVTGNVLAMDVAHFKSSGADHVIPKPVNLALLDACWTNLDMETGP